MRDAFNDTEPFYVADDLPRREVAGNDRRRIRGLGDERLVMRQHAVEHLLVGRVARHRKQRQRDEIDRIDDDGCIDPAREFERGALPGFRNIPLDELRERLGELDPALPVRLVCQSGLRSYVAARMLAGHGFADVSHLAGGLRFNDIVTGDARLIERATPCGADAC